MTSFPPLRAEDLELILRALEGTLDEAGNQRLSQRIVDDPAFRETYRAFIANHAALHAISLSSQQPIRRWMEKETLPVTSPETEASDERILKIEKRAKVQLEAFLAEQHRLQDQQDAVRKPVVQLDMRQLGSVLQQWTRRVDRVFSFTARNVVRLAALMALVLTVMAIHGYFQSQRIVAVVKSMHQAQWDPPLDGNDLRPGPLHLESGYAQLAMTQGAEVLLQAPCTLELQLDNQLYLERGSLCAEVPERAHGFTVETPFSKIVDFGTEFGATVDTENNLEVHVFQGGVGVGSRATRRTRALQDVRAGKVAVLDTTNRVSLYTLGSRPQLFARSLPDADWAGVPGKRIDLADLVGNGNGFGTGQIGQGLAPSSGHFVSGGSVKRGARGRGYVSLPHMPFIDGVFVPDGEDSGRVVVSSTGTVFDRCPDTDGQSTGYLVNGAVFQHEFNPVHAGALGGETYDTRALPSIGLHPNTGISFDLEALRRITQNRDIVRFSALGGISETVRPYLAEVHGASTHNITADLWILVDGQLLFHRTLLAGSREVTAIDLELLPDVRFLTLMTTEGEQGKDDFCWCMLALPLLEIDLPQDRFQNE